MIEDILLYFNHLQRFVTITQLTGDDETETESGAEWNKPMWKNKLLCYGCVVNYLKTFLAYQLFN